MAEYRIPVTTTGSAGSASGTGTSELPIRGWIDSIFVDYHASAPNTTLVDLDESGGAGRKFLDLSAGNTDGVYRVRGKPHGTTGTAGSSDTELFYVANRYVTVTVPTATSR